MGLSPDCPNFSTVNIILIKQNNCDGELGFVRAVRQDISVVCSGIPAVMSDGEIVVALPVQLDEIEGEIWVQHLVAGVLRNSYRVVSHHGSYHGVSTIEIDKNSIGKAPIARENMPL